MTEKIQTDVLIVGGGAAGVAAAIAAAQSGAKVILAERNSFFGGKASAAIVGTICGLYLRSIAGKAHLVCKGFAESFVAQLSKKSKSDVMSNSQGLSYLPYTPFDFKMLCDSLLMDAGVEVYLHTTISGVETENNQVKSISALAFDRKVEFYPHAVIDCSGEAIVSQLAGLKVDESEEYQAAAQVFALHEVASEDERNLSLNMIRELARAAESGLISKELVQVSIVPGSLSHRKLYLKIALPDKIDGKLNLVSMLELNARKKSAELLDFLKENVPAFKNALLGEVAIEAGIRTGRRPIGKYCLTESDVLQCRKFDSGIANGSWPIEYWELGKKVSMNYFAENDFYQIPADCLISNQVNNLFFAGRNISADNKAIASARVIGTCLQSGYAAGKLAAAKVSGQDFEVVISEIRKAQIL